ncbi:hypothetical protein SK128_024230 [Halocaridina rubra]|uniref:Uncharacterized protein n=1 Tax=Halocaridina rubra TaxID=373956 RepID=A0AAN8X2M7_HALRR
MALGAAEAMSALGSNTLNIADSSPTRKRRANFFDLANLLDSDGNLQNEMLVFAFAATMLSTIPVLLGNEFDVNVGLKRDTFDEDSGMSYSYYTAADDTYTPAFFSSNTYEKIMTNSKPGSNEAFHIHGDTSGKDENLMNLLQDLLVWSKEKVKNKKLLPVLINLALDRYIGNKNAADKLVRVGYKKWKEYF